MSAQKKVLFSESYYEVGLQRWFVNSRLGCVGNLSVAGITFHLLLQES